MPLILATRHTTIEAPDEGALDVSILAWQDAMLGELQEWRRHPAGVPTKVPGCGGAKVVPLKPSWLPNSEIEPGNVLIEFRSTRFESGGRWIAHVEARISDRSRKAPPRGETLH